jgi:hypothetical protein
MEPFPNISPNPTSQNAGVPMQKSIRFFIRIFPVFFALVNPPAKLYNNKAPMNTAWRYKKTRLALDYYKLLPAVHLLISLNAA